MLLSLFINFLSHYSITLESSHRNTGSLKKKITGFWAISDEIQCYCIASDSVSGRKEKQLANPSREE